MTALPAPPVQPDLACDDCGTPLHPVGGVAHPYWTCAHCGGAVPADTAP